MVYQRNPLSAALIKAREDHAKTLEQNQKLQDRLTEARQEIRELRADKTRLQARIHNLKKYRPHAPHQPATPRDEAEQRLLDATNEIAAFNRRKRTEKKAA